MGGPDAPLNMHPFSSSTSSSSSNDRISTSINPLRLKHTIFDIPELFPLICAYLSSHDLLQCILVSRHFHTLCIPILYSNIDIHNAFQFYRFRSSASQNALVQNGRYVRTLRTLYYSVLKSFLCEKVDCTNLIRLEFPRTCRFSDPIMPRELVKEAESGTALDGDGCSDEDTLVCGTIRYRTEDIATMVEQNTVTRARNMFGLLDETVLVDFMKKCPRLSVFTMVGFPFDNDLLVRRIADQLGHKSISTTVDNAATTTKDSTIPHTPSWDIVQPKRGLRKLELTNLHYCQVRTRTIEYLMNHCTPDLEVLLLSISHGSTVEPDAEDTDTEDTDTNDDTGAFKEDTAGTQPHQWDEMDTEKAWNLRQLVIAGALSGSQKKSLFWLPLLRRCTQLQSISMDLFTDTAIEQLASVLRQYCPQVNDMSLRCLTGRPLEDTQIRNLSLASSSWRHLTMLHFHGLGPLSIAALIKHSSRTLETLILEECDGFCSEDIQLVLSSCPNLRIFQAMTSNGKEFSSTVYLDARDMVDSPWVCHGLEQLKLVITGIARPDLKMDQYGVPLRGLLNDGTIEGYELQRIVYGQLGRLTRLQKLWLGHDTQDLDDEENYHQTDVVGQWQFIDPDEQFECVEFSLKSGLDLLRGLKELKVLNLDRLHTRIGLNEVQWMVKEWPKLKKVVGLVVHGEKVPKHVQWLYDNHPEIALPSVLGSFSTTFS
ncbi:hypothetical protein BG011_000841 [Mortierella polycephala]|uniref:F-box domain-containing protein n=1 Tax=Mortierella polycephala TaxID=41804 RepID=A0A9P6QEF1_9FUNG|nr:hypothetical protein BG011_000841 [Mortierella polycephala]